MELGWRYGLQDFAMPFFIQVTSELTRKVETVERKNEEAEKEREKQKEAATEQLLDVNTTGFMTNSSSPYPMLMSSDASMGGGMGMNTNTMGGGLGGGIGGGIGGGLGGMGGGLGGGIGGGMGGMGAFP